MKKRMRPSAPESRPCERLREGDAPRYLPKLHLPNMLIIPRSRDFVHDWYGPFGLTDPVPDAVRYDCGTKACVRGWLAIVFDVSLNDVDDCPLARMFADRMLDLAGEEKGMDPVRQVECMFEGFGAYHEAGRMSRRKMAALWRDAAESFGYDTKTARPRP